MKTTIGVKIYPSPTFSFGSTNSTVHELTVTRSTKTGAIAAAIQELIKIGGPELRRSFDEAKFLLGLLSEAAAQARRDPPTPTRPDPGRSDVLKDVNPT